MLQEHSENLKCCSIDLIAMEVFYSPGLAADEKQYHQCCLEMHAMQVEGKQLTTAWTAATPISAVRLNIQRPYWTKKSSIRTHSV